MKTPQFTTFDLILDPYHFSEQCRFSLMFRILTTHPFPQWWYDNLSGTAANLMISLLGPCWERLLALVLKQQTELEHVEIAKMSSHRVLCIINPFYFLKKPNRTPARELWAMVLEQEDCFDNTDMAQGCVQLWASIVLSLLASQEHHVSNCFSSLSTSL